MKICVRYFAALREQRGLSEEALETTAADPRALYAELTEAHGFSLPLSTVKAAINGRFAPMDQDLNEGDEVVFLPPVAGG